MTVLGIDPGIGRLGWGIVEKQGIKAKAIVFGCIETPKEDTLPKRLQAIYEHITNLIVQYQPDAVAVEELFFNTNVSTAFSVGQARGVVLLVASLHNLPVTSYTPAQVKSAVAGYGKADKAQVGRMIKLTLRLAKVPTPDDTADALAIALTHLFSLKIAPVKR